MSIEGKDHLSDILTAQEAMFMGHVSEDLENDQDFYKPKGVLEDYLTIRKTSTLRKALGSFSSLLASLIFREMGVKGEIHLSLEPLDKKGLTIRDPRVLYVKRFDQIIYLPFSDPSAVLYDEIRKREKPGQSYHLRLQK